MFPSYVSVSNDVLTFDDRYPVDGLYGLHCWKHLRQAERMVSYPISIHNLRRLRLCPLGTLNASDRSPCSKGLAVPIILFLHFLLLRCPLYLVPSL